MEKPWLKWYDPGVPASINYPEKPLKDMFNQNAAANPDRPYLIFGDSTITYGEANRFARKLANSFLSLGIKKGDRVAIMSPNYPEYVIALEACYKIGAVAVPTNPMATVRELIHQFKDSGAICVVAWAGVADKAVQILQEQSAFLSHVIVFRAEKDKFQFSDRVIKYEDLLEGSKENEPDIKVSHKDLAMLQYTGGTTGVSKGCMLSNFNILSQAYQDHYWFRNSYADLPYLKTLCCMPLYHIYGFNTNININKVAGGCAILVTVPTIDHILDAIDMHVPNCYAAVPAMIFGLKEHPRTTSSKIRSIKGMICGSSPLAVEVMKRFEELSGATITEGYGLSETSNVLTCTPFGKRKPGSVGLPWPDIDIKIVDIATGKTEMPVGEPGELIARGPNIMSGYWNNEAETANAIRDGWLYTGDIAYMDEDGFFFIVDRKKDMILSSGFNVYPREIDEVIYELPQVFKTCAIGVPDEKRGESVKSFIVLNPGASLTEEEVLRHCRERLSAYKVPKYIEFIDELPLTPVGKPMRNELRKRELEKFKK